MAGNWFSFSGFWISSTWDFPFTAARHQHLHAEGNSHEPQLLRVGIHTLESLCRLPSILVGASIVRWGIRKTFGIGSALILVGALWLAVITSQPWHYWVGFGVLTATGISFGTIIPAATAVTRWFSRYRGRTMAVTLSASGFAGFSLYQ